MFTQASNIISWFNYKSWVFWLLVIFFVILLFWWFFGGKEHEFLGLKPFQPNSSMRGIDSRTKARIGRQFLASGISPNNPEQAMSRIVSDDFISNHLNSELSREEASKNLSDINFSLGSNLDVNNKPKPKQKNQNNIINKRYNNESNGEAICRNVLERIYKKPFNKKRPSWLINPKTKRRMELDGFNEQLMIAFEYDGIQHYKFPNKFHRTEQEFRDQVQRDKDKMQICDEKGVYLMRIPYTVPNNLIKHFIKNILPPDI